MNKNRELLKNQKGFTLIEIIAVLVLIGIMAAVAVPKFFDMQLEAEKKTLEIALNDMKSRAVLTFSKSLLANNGTALVTDLDGLDDLGFSALADVTAAYQDFVGTWALTSNTVITYSLQNDAPNTATFTLTAGTATSPPTIALAFP